MFLTLYIILKGFNPPYLLAQLYVLGNELFQVNIAVADAPPLENNDGYQYQDHQNHGHAQCYCYDKYPFVVQHISFYFLVF